MQGCEADVMRRTWGHQPWSSRLRIYVTGCVRVHVGVTGVCHLMGVGARLSTTGWKQAMEPACLSARAIFSRGSCQGPLKLTITSLPACLGNKPEHAVFQLHINPSAIPTHTHLFPFDPLNNTHNSTRPGTEFVGVGSVCESVRVCTCVCAGV